MARKAKISRVIFLPPQVNAAERTDYILEANGTDY